MARFTILHSTHVVLSTFSHVENVGIETARYVVSSPVNPALTVKREKRAQVGTTGRPCIYDPRELPLPMRKMYGETGNGTR